MLCNDTGKTEIVHVPGLSTAEAQHIGKAIGAVRTVGHGNGEVCIPLVNGLFDKLKIVITSYLEKKKKAVH